MPGQLLCGRQEQKYIAWGCGVTNLLLTGSADPQAAGRCGSASVRRSEPAMFPSVGPEWVSGLDVSSKSILHILSVNPGSNTNQAMLSLAHSSHAW